MPSYTYTPQYDPASGNYNLFPKRQWGPQSYPGAPYGYGAGNPYSVGGTGTPYTTGVGTPIGGGQAGSAWQQAMQDAYRQSQQSYGQGLGALSNSFAMGPLAQGLENSWNKPQGMDPETLRMLQVQMASRNANNQAGAMEDLNNAANAAGFSSSMGLLDAQARLRSQGAANLSDNITNLMAANEALKGQNRNASLQGLLSLYGLDAARLQALAQGYMNQPFIAFSQGQQPGSWVPTGWGPPPGQAWGTPSQ